MLCIDRPELPWYHDSSHTSQRALRERWESNSHAADAVSLLPLPPSQMSVFPALLIFFFFFFFLACRCRCRLFFFFFLKKKNRACRCLRSAIERVVIGAPVEDIVTGSSKKPVCSRLPRQDIITTSSSQRAGICQPRHAGCKLPGIATDSVVAVKAKDRVIAPQDRQSHPPHQFHHRDRHSSVPTIVATCPSQVATPFGFPEFRGRLWWRLCGSNACFPSFFPISAKVLRSASRNCIRPLIC